MTLDPAVVKKALHSDELSLTLKASEGEWPHLVKDAATALKHLDGLLRSLGKGMDPPVSVVPVLIRVDVLDENLRFVVRLDPPRTRARKKAGRTAAPAERDAGQAESKGDSSATEADLGL